MPWPLMEGISHGLTILSWYESYTEKDVPPENMWDDVEGLEEHWKTVKLRETSGESSDDDEDDDEPDHMGGARGPGPQMLGNELASVFKD